MADAKRVPDNRGDSARELGRLAWLLDDAIRVPFTSYRIGLDGLIGLIPGVGDAAGAMMSLYIVARAARLGAGPGLLLRMLGNVALESLCGLVPVLGDLFDFAFKANRRNVALLEGHLNTAPVDGEGGRSLRWLLLLVLAAAVLLLGLMFWAVIALVQLLAGAMG
ncbi:DUF4112 domain-containing protein [Parahaliea mediterranea]|uniref:DUF4112 domain-containing protein n=1 Tax=Parahaliea mediterranea TaxID=651086 RepID=UPI001F4D6560|nr:DUF4112 domain-containing protein [Parahaliea mediterranea]